MGVQGGADSITLGLGQQSIELLQFDRRGRPYPEASSSSDLVFQHFALVVADMHLAYQRLETVGGWSAITSGGPQRLPGSSGGVTAFKFRDPDGHPLELLAFLAETAPLRWRTASGDHSCLGIDHSAIGVSDTARSIAFYEALGLRLSTRSVNRGAEQARLDGLKEPVVEVTALVPRIATPHLEMLYYRSVARGHRNDLQNNDAAATRLVLETSGRSRIVTGDDIERSVVDPDGHHLLIVPPAE
jgi:catechol 2,3-dioxygenase-like lactoylglutathione lyase family enzyme